LVTVTQSSEFLGARIRMPYQARLVARGVLCLLFPSPNESEAQTITTSIRRNILEQVQHCRNVLHNTALSSPLSILSHDRALLILRYAFCLCHLTFLTCISLLLRHEARSLFCGRTPRHVGNLDSCEYRISKCCDFCHARTLCYTQLWPKAGLCHSRSDTSVSLATAISTVMLSEPYYRLRSRSSQL